MSGYAEANWIICINGRRILRLLVVSTSIERTTPNVNPFRAAPSANAREVK